MNQEMNQETFITPMTINKITRHRIISVILCFVILGSMVPDASAADYHQADLKTISLSVNGKTFEAAAIDASYVGNLYISLRSAAEALAGTDKQFNIYRNYTSYDGTYFALEMGKEYAPLELEYPSSEEGGLFLDLSRNRLFVDGSEKKYYSFVCGEPADIFLNITDLLLLLNIKAELEGDNLSLLPEEEFSVSAAELKESGLCSTMNSALAGDAESGKILFSTNPRTAYPIASLTKLMTYLLLAEAVEQGRVSFEDQVVISEAVQKLSLSEDGIIPLEEGEIVPLEELTYAMLIASSNEAALAIAEHVWGSEESFVEKMNERAKELKLSSALFYNCNGLPVIRQGIIPVKLQNKMCSADLFTLCSYLLENYPEITDITALQYARMEALDYTSANSNPLVFNMEDVTGLKTGNTKAAGQCLAACNKAGIIVIVLGAEDASTRGRAAQLLFKALA